MQTKNSKESTNKNSFLNLFQLTCGHYWGNVSRAKDKRLDLCQEALTDVMGGWASAAI